MITVNGNIIEQNRFPDNTLNIKVYASTKWEDYIVNGADAYLEPTWTNHISWEYENDAELFTLICVRKHLAKSKCDLFLPYIPHARMDRVKDPHDVFTLKYFCNTYLYIWTLCASLIIFSWGSMFSYTKLFFNTGYQMLLYEDDA